MSSEKKRAGIEQGVYKSALINALKFDELQQKSGLANTCIPNPCKLNLQLLVLAHCLPF